MKFMRILALAAVAAVGCSKGGSLTGGSFTWGQGDTFNDSPNYGASDEHVTGTYTLVVTKIG